MREGRGRRGYGRRGLESRGGTRGKRAIVGVIIVTGFDRSGGVGVRKPLGLRLVVANTASVPCLRMMQQGRKRKMTAMKAKSNHSVGKHLCIYVCMCLRVYGGGHLCIIDVENDIDQAVERYRNGYTRVSPGITVPLVMNKHRLRPTCRSMPVSLHNPFVSDLLCILPSNLTD